ncbi:MAG TPA: cellulase family glycosylhydrolase [Acidimicrobiales bacterium]|nr:cellulase family glycosylhydrolase [Acidimicrobiales bacterium]
MVAAAVALLLAGVTVAILTLTGGKSTTVKVAADAPAVGPYVIHGDELLDGDGRPFFLHGVDRPSLEWSCAGQAIGGGTGIPASDFSAIRAWGANTVRISLNQDYWLSALGVPVAPGAHCPGYIDTVKAAVHEAEADHLVVVLDLHSSDPGNPQLKGGPQPMPDQGSVRFWRSVAHTFGGDWNVMFELFNEPRDVSWTVWQDGGQVKSGPHTYRAVGMQQLVDAVRGTGAHNVILADGVNFAATLAGVPSHLLTGGGIGYAIHPYAGTDTTSPSVWQRRFGFLTSTHLVVATEFGDQRPGVTGYDSNILDFFRSHAMGWTAWAWWDGNYKFPSLIDGRGACVDAGCPDRDALLAFARGRSRMVVPRAVISER